MEELIFIDLDKTLIDASYKLTADLSEAAASCAARSIGLGLCSDTPLEPLKHWSEKLGFKGPIIAELGSLVYFPESAESVVIHPESTGFFPDVRRDFLKDLATLLPDATIFVGDNVQFIAEDIILDFLGEMVVLVSGYRSQSMAFHVRRFDRDRNLLLKDAGYLQRIADIARKALAEHDVPSKDLWFDINEEYGIAIIHSRRTNKKDGMVVAMEKLNISQVGMIGDSMADFMNDPRVIQLAVANAKPEYKEKCHFITPYEYTKGVRHLLEAISSRHVII